MSRVLFLMPTHTYRARAFLQAARKLGIQAVVGSEKTQALEPYTSGRTLTLDFLKSDEAVHKIVQFCEELPLDAIIPVDDDTVVVAAKASQQLGLPSNPPEAVQATREKHRLREKLHKAGLQVPNYKIFHTGEDVKTLSQQVNYPCVLKPVFLSASRGVIRANQADEFIHAFHRIKKILEDSEVVQRGGDLAELVLVEDYVPGIEVALEGLLTHGQLKVLAIFDKPDPLEGPYFEETIYMTPSRLDSEMQDKIKNCVQETTRVLGLQHGPIHAEIRINEQGVWIIEIAARSIGGLCARSLRFNRDTTLEELILRHALGEDVSPWQRESQASGVMMIPIPKAGTLKAIRGLDEAKLIAGIEDVILSIPVGQPVIPLPEGNRYLGFIFARRQTPQAVETAIRKAYQRLQIEIS